MSRAGNPLLHRFDGSGTPADPPDLSPQLHRAILRALEPFPDARIAVADALTKEIEPEPCPACGRK